MNNKKKDGAATTTCSRLLMFHVCVLTLAILPIDLSRAADGVAIADFRANPLPPGWKVEGYAFGTRSPGSQRQQAAKTTPNQRQYETGKLTSPRRQ